MMSFMIKNNALSLIIYIFVGLFNAFELHYQSEFLKTYKIGDYISFHFWFSIVWNLFTILELSAHSIIGSVLIISYPLYFLRPVKLLSMDVLKLICFAIPLSLTITIFILSLLIFIRIQPLVEHNSFKNV